MNKPLVSIITPAYNSFEFISNLFDSIIAQDYSNIEFILVNDGSTDNLNKLVKTYKEKFKKHSISFKYFEKENGGAASAVNIGIKNYTGQYLFFIDSDDGIRPTAISKMVEFLEKNKEFGYVRINGRMVDETGVQKRTLWPKDESRVKLFEDLIFENKVVYIGYMFRESSFKKVHKEKPIYESYGGQNWQLLLPMAYKYDCGYIEEELFNYLVRNSSHSHDLKDADKKIERLKIHRDILNNTLSKIDNLDKKYSSRLDDKYSILSFITYFEFGDRHNLKKQYKILKNNKLNNYKFSIMYLLSMLHIEELCMDLYRGVKRWKKY